MQIIHKEYMDPKKRKEKKCKKAHRKKKKDKSVIRQMKGYDT